MYTRTQTRRRARPAQRVNARELPWSYIFLVVVCGVVLAAGFFFAGLQHFTSMEYGIKNSKLRKQVDSLEAEKRRLLLAKEVALSPSEIRKAARGVNARRAEMARAGQRENDASKSETANGGSVVKTAATEAAKPGAAKKLVAATVKSEPVKRSASERGRETGEKKDKFEITAVAKLR